MLDFKNHYYLVKRIMMVVILIIEKQFDYRRKELAWGESGTVTL